MIRANVAALALAMALAACERPKARCEDLSPAGCMDTKTCILEPQANHDYACRTPRTACERVAGTFAPDLAARGDAHAGCRFQVAECFCGIAIQNAGVCACGGGPPARCADK